LQVTDIKEHINYKKLHYLIEKLNLEFPVAELSRKTGYSDATISPYVSGKVKASTKFLQKICEVYGVGEKDRVMQRLKRISNKFA
jgi:transcriptional regulator with XRE-family HTH domain